MGCVYILVNQDMPGLIKIGRTNRTAVSRARQLSEATGVPSPFEVACALRCKKYKELEKNMHKKLHQYRRPNREFFEYPVDDAILLLKKLGSEYPDIEMQSLTEPSPKRRAPSKQQQMLKKYWNIRKQKGDRIFILHLATGKDVPCVYNPECEILRFVLGEKRLVCMPNSTESTKKHVWEAAQMYREYFDAVFAGETPTHKPPGILN